MKSNLVKTFLVLNLILCAGVLGVSIKMFMDREVVKARTIIHRQNIKEVATNLSWGQTLPWEAAGDRKPGAFILPDPQNIEEIGTLKAQLEELASLAETRLSQLNKEYAELVVTQKDLESTREVLAQRVQELADTRGRVSNLESNLLDTQKTLRDTQTELASLDREQSALQQQVDGLNAQITSQQEKVSYTEDQLKLRTEERNRIEALLASCNRPRKTGDSVAEWHQQTAQILAVEPDWNYVVINRGEVDVLPMYLEAFVHRGDTFIGKIRVMQVDRTVALAEIVTETLVEGETIKAGDTIFF